MIKVGNLVKIIGNAQRNSNGSTDGVRHHFNMGEVVRIVDIDAEGDFIAQRIEDNEGIEDRDMYLVQYVESRFMELVEGGVAKW